MLRNSKVSPPKPDRTGLPSYYGSLLFQIHDVRFLISLPREQSLWVV